MNIFENVALFEHGQYLVNAGASLDHWPSVPVKNEVAALIFAKAKQNSFVVGIENGDHTLTIVQHRGDTCTSKALRTQLVAKRRQDGNVARGEAFAVECDDRHLATRFPRCVGNGCVALTDQGNEAVNRSGALRRRKALTSERICRPGFQNVGLSPIVGAGLCGYLGNVG